MAKTKAPRTIIVTLEIETTAPLTALKSKSNWNNCVFMFVTEEDLLVKQVTAKEKP